MLANVTQPALKEIASHEILKSKFIGDLVDKAWIKISGELISEVLKNPRNPQEHNESCLEMWVQEVEDEKKEEMEKKERESVKRQWKIKRVNEVYKEWINNLIKGFVHVEFTRVTERIQRECLQNQLREKERREKELRAKELREKELREKQQREKKQHENEKRDREKMAKECHENLIRENERLEREKKERQKAAYEREVEKYNRPKTSLKRSLEPEIIPSPRRAAQMENSSRPESSISRKRKLFKSRYGPMTPYNPVVGNESEKSESRLIPKLMKALKENDNVFIARMREFCGSLMAERGNKSISLADFYIAEVREMEKQAKVREEMENRSRHKEPEIPFLDGFVDQPPQAEISSPLKMKMVLQNPMTQYEDLTDDENEVDRTEDDIPLDSLAQLRDCTTAEKIIPDKTPVADYVNRPVEANTFVESVKESEKVSGPKLTLNESVPLPEPVDPLPHIDVSDISDDDRDCDSSVERPSSSSQITASNLPEDPTAQNVLSEPRTSQNTTATLENSALPVPSCSTSAPPITSSSAIKSSPSAVASKSDRPVQGASVPPSDDVICISSDSSRPDSPLAISPPMTPAAPKLRCDKCDDQTNYMMVDAYQLIKCQADLEVHHRLWHNSAYQPTMCEKCQYREENPQAWITIISGITKFHC